MKIKFHPRTLKFLKKITSKERQLLLQKISKLKDFPEFKELNVKKLAGTKNSFRLRVGQIRVIFEAVKEDNTIYIHEINFRGSIY